MNTESQISINVGVDVGKSKLDIVLHPLDLHFQIPNDEDSILKVVHVLKKRNIERIVVEATGRYEHAFVFTCDQANLPIVVVNPISIRRYAQAIAYWLKPTRSMPVSSPALQQPSSLKSNPSLTNNLA